MFSSSLETFFTVGTRGVVFCAEIVRLERGEGEQNQVFVLNDVSGNLAHAHIHSGLMNLL
jgi:hypothetical protein